MDKKKEITKYAYELFDIFLRAHVRRNLKKNYVNICYIFFETVFKNAIYQFQAENICKLIFRWEQSK